MGEVLYGGDGGAGGGGGGGVNITIGGNVDGVPVLVSTGTAFLAGGNNVTLSQNGNSITISAAAVGAGSFTAGVSNVGNTSGDTGAVANRLVLAGGTNITLSGSNNGQSATVTIFGNNAFKAGVSTGGNTAGDTKTVSNQLVMVGGTNITLSQATAAGGATVSVIGAAAQTGISSIAADGTTYSSGQIVFVGSNAASVNSSAAGQTLIIDVPAQTVQTQNLHNVTLAGNTSGALADISSGTMTLAGGNGITLSQLNNAVTISGPIPREAVSIAGNSTSAGAGYMLVSTGTLILAGGNNITLSQDGHSLTISGANAGGAQTGISSIIASNATYTSGAVEFVGSGIVTVKSGTGQVVIIDAAGGGGGIAASIGGNSTSAGAGYSNVTSGTVVLMGGNNITLSQNGASVTISGAAQGGVQTGISSIVASDATYTSGQVVFSGSGIATVRSGTGQHVYIDVPSGGGAGVSSLGNTAGTTGTVDYQLVFVGGSNVTLSQSVNGSSGTITINGASGGGAGFSGGMSTEGNTAGTAGTVDRQVIFVGGSNISLSQSVNGSSATLTINGPVGGGAGMGSAGNSAGTSGSVGRELYFYGSNNITLSQSVNGASASLSVIGAAAGTAGGFTAGVSSEGNTAGTTGLVPAQIVFVGGSNVTLSQSINASSATITIDGAPVFAFSAGVSTHGNTSGDTGSVLNGVVFAGGNNITLSQVTGASGATITFSGISVPSSSSYTNSVSSVGSVGTLSSRFALADHAHAGVWLMGVGDVGNTEGNTRTGPGAFVLSGGNNITLSALTDSGDRMTIGIRGPASHSENTLSQWMPPGMGVSSFQQIGQSSLVMFPAAVPARLNVSRADIFVSNSVSTSSNSSHQATLSLALGIYTRNVSTLSLASSGSVSYTWNVTGSTSLGSLAGMRGFSIPIAATFQPGDHFIGILSQTATTNANWVTLSNLVLQPFGSAYSGLFGATNASNQFVAGGGIFTVQTAALPASVAFSDLQATSASTARPVVNFLNFTA